MKKLFAAVLFILTMSILLPAEAVEVRHELDYGWKFQRVSPDVYQWHPATVPGCVQTDLMAIGEIGDPYFRMNEISVQWIDKEDWKYRTVFDAPADVMDKDNVFICFDGLDVFADVTLNGEQIITADNMFRQWRTDIKDLLKSEGNVIEVYFHSITRKGLELADASPYWFDAANDLSHIGGLFDKKINMYIRKAPYNFGWDWGPRLLTMGIWKPVWIEGWNDARIESTHYVTVSADRKQALMDVEVEVLADGTVEQGEIVISSGGNVYSRIPVELKKGMNRFDTSFKIRNPRLWWCNGMGSQELYDFTVSVISAGEVLSSKTERIGIRTVQLEQEADEYGKSFRFILNGVPVYAKGVNAIPFDNILTNVDSETYRRHLVPAAEANMNMVRVWGGGIYESDEFYRQCDSLGIMVWQDFVFSCSLYPSQGQLLENMKVEFAENIRRIRNHPSLALWCGNNELHYSWRSSKMRARNTPEQMQELWKMYMDQNDAIEAALDSLCPEIDYQPSSPFRGFDKDEIPEEGDRHFWAVLAGLEPVSALEREKSRFFSEYGYESFDYYESLVKYAPESKDQSIYSDVMLWHQRQGYNALRANGNIIRYISDNYPQPSTFKDTLYASHVLQADIIKLAIEAHRRNKGFCWGSLYWQLNNCWPVSSDSSIDYYGNWKSLHYAVRRAFEQKLVSGYVGDGNLDVYIVTDALKPEKGTLSVEVVTMDGKVISSVKKKVSVPANSSAMVYRESIGKLLGETLPEDAYARFIFTDSEGHRHGNMRFFSNQKDVRFMCPDIKWEVTDRGDCKEVKLVSDVFARAVYLSVKDSDILHFSENFFDLYPGEEYVVTVKTDITAEDLSERLQTNTINYFL